MRSLVFAVSGLILVPPAAAAQTPSLAQLAVRFAGMTAVSGYEQAMADSLRRLLPGARLDRAGNVVLSLGQGEPRRVVVCPLDEPGYVVGGLRDDGYLTLRRVGRTHGRLFDQQLEGQRVTVWGARGPLPGVVAVRSIHLTSQRPGRSGEPFQLDDALVEVGAADSATALAAGIRVLSPVTLAKRPFRYGDSLIAAPVAGRRTACAALAHIALSRPAVRGTVVIAFVVEQDFTGRGLRTLLRTAGPFDAGRLVDGPGPEGDRSPEPDRLRSLPVMDLPVHYAGSPVETVSLAAAASFEATLRAWIGGGS